MTTLQFADTHNLVVFLAKPVESEGFEKIMDFLNAHTVKYALTVNPTIYTSCTEQFWATVKVKTVNGESSVPSDNVVDEAINEEMDDSLVRAATTVEQDSGNINKTQSKATPNEPSSLGTSSGDGRRRQETMGDTIAQTGFENVSKTSNDSLLAGVNTPQSDEDRLKLNEFMEFCTKLQQRVLDLENTKTAQAQEITSLKLRVKKLEKKGGSGTYKLKRLYKVGRSARVISFDEASLGDQEDASKQGRKIDDNDKDAEITLVHETQGRYGDEEIFDTCVIDGDEVKVQDKGKGIMVEEPVKIKKKDQISLDEELAFKLQVKEEEEERLAREKAQREEEANIVAWDNVQVMIDADYQMAQQMQAKEQEKLSIEEKSKLFVHDVSLCDVYFIVSSFKFIFCRLNQIQHFNR
ncbi:hypothetical protein Tco_0530688 [Tanacetum coccineum]